MNITLDIIKTVLLSDEFKMFVETGDIKAIVLQDETVNLMDRDGLCLTTYIPVEQK